jgi:fused signal recognition particle receptor
MAFNWLKKEKETTQRASFEAKASPSSGDASGNSGIFSKLKQGLSKTRKILTTDIDELFTVRKRLDDSVLEELEERLITADIGVQTTITLIERISKKAAHISDAGELKSFLKEQIRELLIPREQPEKPASGKPLVIMVIGVNGVGKTTTIGKIAAKMRADNKKVIIGAADTFRAAAIEQLTIWAEKAGAEIVKHKDNADPAAVAFDTVEAAVAREADVVLIDTAGRLHTKINLMEELKKIKRTIAKKIPEGPHEILLVLDATTGQNALSQAQMFNDALGVTGIALTKLDGTAKGGIVISICHTLNIPLQYIGVGEKVDDLQLFDPNLFLEALF